MPARAVIRFIARMASFCDFILGVCFVRPEKKMRWINAWRVIANMAKDHFVGNGSDEGFIYKSVSHGSSFSKHDVTIARRSLAAGPFPAPGFLDDVSPGYSRNRSIASPDALDGVQLLPKPSLPLMRRAQMTPAMHSAQTVLKSAFHTRIVA